MDCRVAQPPLLHVLSKFRTYFRTNSSPEGRGWPEGPGEGCKDSSLHPSPTASRQPLPSGRGIRKTHTGQFLLYVVFKSRTPSNTPGISALVHLDSTAPSGG